LQRRAHLARDLTDHRQKQEEIERTCAGGATQHGGRKPATPGGARESPACPCTGVETATTKSKPFKRNDQVGSTFWFNCGQELPSPWPAIRCTIRGYYTSRDSADRTCQLFVWICKEQAFRLVCCMVLPYTLSRKKERIRENPVVDDSIP
jgi:hypothetical protein